MENNENQNSSYKMVNFTEEKNKTNFAKSIVVPFISGTVGACLMIGVAFGVPSVNQKLVSLSKADVSSPVSTTPTISSTEKLNLTSHSDVGSYAASKILPSIVGITVNFPVNSMFGGQNTATVTGSGIILSQDGYIVTNNHVVNSREHFIAI